MSEKCSRCSGSGQIYAKSNPHGKYGYHSCYECGGSGKKVGQQKNIQPMITQLIVKKTLAYAQHVAVMAHSKGLILVQPVAQFKT